MVPGMQPLRDCPAETGFTSQNRNHHTNKQDSRVGTIFKNLDLKDKGKGSKQNYVRPGTKRKRMIKK